MKVEIDDKFIEFIIACLKSVKKKKYTDEDLKRFIQWVLYRHGYSMLARSVGSISKSEQLNALWNEWLPYMQELDKEIPEYIHSDIYK